MALDWSDFTFGQLIHAVSAVFSCTSQFAKIGGPLGPRPCRASINASSRALSTYLALDVAIMFSHSCSIARQPPHLPPPPQSPHTFRWLAQGLIPTGDSGLLTPAILVSDENKRWVFSPHSCPIPAPPFVQESSIENREWKLRRHSVMASARV